MDKFIGEKKIKEFTKTEEKTPGGISLVKVEFEDGSIELFSELMYEKITSEEACDSSKLREKRVFPVVEVLLAVLREWGVKLGELGYVSAVLNQSLDFNQKEAVCELWSNWMQKPPTPEDVDLVAVDRVLRNKHQTVKDVLGDKA